MNAGRLNKPEKARLLRQWQELQRMIDDCGPGDRYGDTGDRDRAALQGPLIRARNAIGEILRWQDKEPTMGGPTA